ncbi:MAG TPA: SUMF1/EgtB/PvdO family nonheme iron enzyme [Steroidobacteraceae bacterium]|nr:SUMF1/EgtB/PvdO family nonheme iron enzyme [Steroidobacteraceae bacterium]
MRILLLVVLSCGVANAASERAPGTVFRDCKDCPEMVVIPAGTLTMGSSAAEKSWAVNHGATADALADEAPQHEAWLRSFALGKNDVTRGEYAAFVRETSYPAGEGCGRDGGKWLKQSGVSWQKPGFKQTERDPVVCVSWQDARAYVAWLNGKVLRSASTSEGPYRLPSEAEWEYAARAGTTTRFWWGDDEADAASHAWYKANSGERTHPVGSKPANAFGLYDMAGNVWQWTEDCYTDSYRYVPTDGSANETGNGCLRVDRGSSWFYPSWLLRPATRERNPADYRDMIMGFRLARTLESAPRAELLSVARAVDLKTPDGTLLKASYFAAAKPGPGVLLFHQSNRTRKEWNDVAVRLAAAGINTLTVDNRAYGDSGGTDDSWNKEKRPKHSRADDNDIAYQYLVSQPGVTREVIGVGGAGALGVLSAVEAARRHAAEVKSLVLLSGETLKDGIEFLKHASQLPELFVVADDDEYPPTVEAMELLYINASSPMKRLVHYSTSEEAPWIWYEPFDIGRVPATGGHGTDLLGSHPELPGIIHDWLVTTLVKTPGHAPVDTLASAQVISQLQMPGGVAEVTQRLTELRKNDPMAQLFPEITVSIIGQDHMRAGETRLAVEVLQLVLLAYPDSADAHESLAEAYLADGQKDLARQHAAKTLALLDARTVPASSWSDTEPRRGEIRQGAQDVLDKLSAAR